MSPLNAPIALHSRPAEGDALIYHRPNSKRSHVARIMFERRANYHLDRRCSAGAIITTILLNRSSLKLLVAVIVGKTDYCTDTSCWATTCIHPPS